MNNSEKRQQYLEVYRQQLKREMDAMGYGQRRENTHNFQRQARTRSTSNRTFSAIAFKLLKYR